LETLQQILTTHLLRYPKIQVQDIYKLLHQACLGSEHNIQDELEARDWLERELAGMGDGPDDPLMDRLSPAGQILRIHLRPYLRAGKDPEKLLQAFLNTAQSWRGSSKLLKEYGVTAAWLVQRGSWSIRWEEIESFFVKMEEKDFPAMHHSKVYIRLYRPAYRVVASQFLEEI